MPGRPHASVSAQTEMSVLLHQRALSSKSSALPGLEAFPCLMLALNSSESQPVEKLHHGMLKRWQAERMSLCFLPSSRNQTGGGKKLVLFSLSFSSGSVNNNHSTGRRKRVLDEVFKGSWSNLLTTCSFLLPTSHCSQSGCFSRGMTEVGFSLQRVRCSFVCVCCPHSVPLPHPALP